MAKILDGKKLSDQIKSELATEVASLKQNGILPKLGVILIGEFPPSIVYVRNKEKACLKVGIETETIRLARETKIETILTIIDKWNNDEKYHGILVQMPLPDHISQDEVLMRISPKKDVDGLTPVNFGKLLTSEPYFYPCTPLGIIELLKANEIEIQGKHVVIVGRGGLVGKPLANMLLQKNPDHGNATVTVCHTKTKDISAMTRQADILVVAIGSPKFLKKDMVKPGVAIVDAGTNRVEVNGEPKLVGDVDFEEVEKVASAITPVPGGIGPMTVAMLLKNTVKSATIKC
jgi:methylenetetrahydrofolate dehydrogenase (NADP+) / methenyltetrahydrofolate cyclohydrolase